MTSPDWSLDALVEGFDNWAAAGKPMREAFKTTCMLRGIHPADILQAWYWYWEGWKNGYESGSQDGYNEAKMGEPT